MLFSCVCNDVKCNRKLSIEVNKIEGILLLSYYKNNIVINTISLNFNDVLNELLNYTHDKDELKQE